MRFHYVVLATAVSFLASGDFVVASVNADQSKLVMGAETRALTADQNAIADKRLLRTTPDDSLSADEGESSFAEKTKFYYWYWMGRTPQYVYKDFFEGMDRSIIVNNPNYEVWKRYKDFYNKEENTNEA